MHVQAGATPPGAVPRGRSLLWRVWLAAALVAALFAVVALVARDGTLARSVAGTATTVGAAVATGAVPIVAATIGKKLFARSPCRIALQEQARAPSQSGASRKT